MKTMKHNLRTSALPAIAAALALSSTSALAQQAQPVPADPPVAGAAADQPAPASQAEPAANDTSAAAPTADSTAAASDVKTASTSAPKTVKRTMRPAHSAAKAPTRAPIAKPVAQTHVASRSVTTHAALSAAAAPAPAAQTSQSAVKPLVDVNAGPAPTTTAAAKPLKKHDDTLPIAGGALAFLAIGGAAVALTRRRHGDEEEWVQEDTAEPIETSENLAEPAIHVEEPAMIAPAASAFAWGERDGAREGERRNEEAAGDDDRLPGESWVQRAYRGPSANNPSVSLRARLKRAAFFDKRERDVAAGRADPVDMDAGLPEAMVEEQERELA
jgi:Tfp pilus assembly protein FimT